MSNLFSLPELKNKVSRNGFDLQKRVIASAKFGEILPMWHKECLPGDHIELNVKNFSRTPACSEAAFTRFRHYFDFYFVPMRLLWRDFPSFATSMANTAKSATSINSNRVVGSLVPQTTTNALINFLEHLSPDGLNECAWRGDPRNTSYDSSTCDSIIKNKGLLTHYGFSRVNNTAKLLQYLGYYRVFNPSLHTKINEGTSGRTEANVQLNLWPLLAYQKIYYDYFRDSQWESEKAECYNIDYLSAGQNIPITNLYNCYTENGRKETMFDLHYCNYQKDVFFGCKPSAQYGAVSTIDVDIESLSSVSGLSGKLYNTSRPSGGTNPVWSSDFALGHETGSESSGDLFDISNSSSWLSDALSNLSGSFSILQLRAAQAKQKFLEISLTNNQDYKSQIEAHFGVKVSSLMSGLCDYIGGVSGDFTLSTIANTNLVDGNSATLNAIGTASADGHISFDCKEHGIIMCIYHALPLMEYAVQGYDFDVLKVNFDSYAIPEFDKLGLEEVSTIPLTGNAAPIQSIGYNSRYYEYKTDYDIVLGAMNGNLLGTVPNYSIQIGYGNNSFFRFNSGEIVNYEYFKVNPNIVDSLFGVNQTSDITTDVIYLCTDFDAKFIRNLDRDGLPY